MKQLFVGLGVFGVFIAYSLWVRHELPAITGLPKSEKATSTATSSVPTSQDTHSPANNAQQNRKTAAAYKNGTYIGPAADAFYGNVQVSATVTGGKIVDVLFLQYPDTHDTSVMINEQAMPYLKQEVLQSQRANVQIVSGATFTSQAFIQSLTAALSQAKA